MEGGFCTGRDDVIPALTGVSGQQWAGEQRVCTTAGGGMAKMENTYASLGSCWRRAGRRHCVSRTDVPKKTFFSCYFFKICF